MKVEFKEITTDDIYNPSKYQERGFLINFFDNCCYFVSQDIACFIGTTEFVSPYKIEESREKVETPTRTVGEDFALKMLSIATKNDRFKDL